MEILAVYELKTVCNAGAYALTGGMQGTMQGGMVGSGAGVNMNSKQGFMAGGGKTDARFCCPPSPTCTIAFLARTKSKSLASML
jgi:hypothetical protein